MKQAIIEIFAPVILAEAMVAVFAFAVFMLWIVVLAKA